MHLTQILNPIMWDQNDKTVNINLHISDILHADVDYLKTRLEFTLKVTKYCEQTYIVNLGGEIKPDKCEHTWNTENNSLYITLHKIDNDTTHWLTPINGVYNPKGNYWDDIGRLGDEIEEVAPNNGFNDWMIRQVFKDASDEQKRAVMKSFTESNGTVISTDWSDVANRTVTKPPKTTT